MLLRLKLILFLIILLSLIIHEIEATEKGCPAQETILPCRCLIRGKEYQIWCSHSNLSSVLEGLKSIANFITTPIDELILENNYLPSLPGRTFSPLQILRLMLRHNALERVSTDWLADLDSSLMELFIVEPKLNNLPQLSLIHLKKIKAVTVRSKLLKRLPLFSGLPLLRYLQIESTSLIELAASNFKENPSLEKFHIQFSPKLTRLEANLFDDLPKLDLINISYCGLSWMHPRAFSRLPNLKELSLIGNKFNDPGMIGRNSRELPNLEVIRLDFNYINTLDEATFVDMQSLKSIYLSNNVINEVKKGSFHRLPSLRTLDLSKNMLRRIQRQSFYQPSFLEELNLQENDLSDVLQIRSILEDLPKLVYLDLSYNKLVDIPFGSLMGHSTLEQLNLGYNRLHMIDKEAFIGMPALRDLVLTNNSIIDTLRIPFWNLPALKSLAVSKNYLRKLEPRFLTNIGSLRRADFSKNGLNFVDPESFLSTPLLEHINLSSNNLKIIHPITFRHLTQLYELDVSRNNLKSLVPGLPGNIEQLHLRQNEISRISSMDLELPSLRLLDLSENRIQSLEDSQLKGLIHLRRLYFNSNFLRSLGERSLDGLIQLEFLDLSDNRISEIHPLAMRPIIELEILNIANNQLTVIGPSLLSNAKNLKKLNASHNQLGEILAKSFDDNLNLEDLDLSSNLLVQFPHTLFGLEKLKKLDLSSNRLKNINSSILSSLTNLREIKLSKNFIQILEENSFGNLKHLKIIFLDENDVMLVEQNFIKTLPALKLLKLQRNKIEELPSQSFNTLLSLQNTELQENNIRFIDPHAFSVVPQLLTLNLSHNEILKIEDAGLQSLRSLELLDMSFNKITKMSPSLSQLEWLVELRLRNNYICEVEEGGFLNMPRLKVLDLRNNKLVSFPEVAVERLRENTAQLDVRGNPVSCSCDMLWLKSWLRESSQSSPRCSDGTLLREMPLSSRDCPSDRQKDNRDQFSGCNTELLNAPAFGNSEMYSKYASLRNFSENVHAETDNSEGQNNNCMSDAFQNLRRMYQLCIANNEGHRDVTLIFAESLRVKNHLAPSPEESEYFYDDYIDYPFNESVVDPSGYLSEKFKDKKHTIVERVPLTTKQSGGNKTGNTPVLYAASSKKKQKPDIPAKVPDSPSTSGFTFFGIPLPPLSLNNLFGKKDDGVATPIHAERKNAIMNSPRKDKRQPTPKSGGLIPQISLVPHLSQNPQQLPRPMPELQGGFMPILPGSGGFKPIPDPRFTFTSTIPTNTEKRRPIETSLQQPEIEEIKSHDLSVIHNDYSLQPSESEDTEPLENPLQQKNYNLELETNKSSLIISADSTSVANNRNKKSQLIDGKINITRLESIANVQLFNKSEMHSFVKEYPSENTSIIENVESTSFKATRPLKPTLETTHSPEPTTSTTIKPELELERSDTSSQSEKSDETHISQQSDKPNATQKTEPTITLLSVEEVKDSELTGMETQIKETEERLSTPTEASKTEINSDFKINKHPASGSLLSTLLIPGGQQPFLKPTAKSTITKVVSPHVSRDKTPLLSTVDVLEAGDIKLDMGKMVSISEEDRIITSTEDGSKDNGDWYFENYNKKNLEPFVAKIITDKNSANKSVRTKMFIVLTLTLILMLFG